MEFDRGAGGASNLKIALQMQFNNIFNSVIIVGLVYRGPFRGTISGRAGRHAQSAHFANARRPETLNKESNMEDSF